MKKLIILVSLVGFVFSVLEARALATKPEQLDILKQIRFSTLDGSQNFCLYEFFKHKKSIPQTITPHLIHKSVSKWLNTHDYTLCVNGERNNRVTIQTSSTNLNHSNNPQQIDVIFNSTHPYYMDFSYSEQFERAIHRCLLFSHRLLGFSWMFR